MVSRFQVPEGIFQQNDIPRVGGHGITHLQKPLPKPNFRFFVSAVVGFAHPTQLLQVQHTVYGRLNPHVGHARLAPVVTTIGKHEPWTFQALKQG